MRHVFLHGPVLLWLGLLTALAPPLARPARAAEIQVLSGGALEPGLEVAMQNFRSTSGQGVRIAYATAPRIRERLLNGEAPDLLIAPQAFLDEMVQENRVTGVPVPLGRVGVGMVARLGVAVSPIETAEGLRLALGQAQAVVFNRASTGLYLERLFDRLGMTAVVAPKARRYATGAEVMEHLLRGSGAELGFAAITEIRMVRELRYIGPLPPELQSYTLYGAALLPDGPATAEVLLRWLTGPEARGAFEAAGIEAPR
ncbi:MAG: hypothetical protein JWP04_3330 [Belnapia sp.]|nr:hypothetical protein [Belnapia sp.]